MALETRLPVVVSEARRPRQRRLARSGARKSTGKRDTGKRGSARRPRLPVAAPAGIFVTHGLRSRRTYGRGIGRPLPPTAAIAMAIMGVTAETVAARRAILNANSISCVSPSRPGTCTWTCTLPT